MCFYHIQCQRFIRWSAIEALEPHNFFETCERLCPVQCQQDADRAFFVLAEAVKHRDEKLMSDCRDKVSQLKPVAVESLKTVEKRKSRDEDDTEYLQEEEQLGCVLMPR